jgi:hypothetical protein
MSVLLNELIHYQFSHDEIITYAEQSLPVYSEAFKTNDLLISQLKDAGIYCKDLLNALNRNPLNKFTPDILKYDTDRDNTLVSLKNQLESNSRRYKVKPELAEASDKLLDLLALKCPKFLKANNNEETIMIDSFRTEMEKPEFAELIPVAGVTELVNELFDYNDKFKKTQDQRIDDNNTDTPLIRQSRQLLMKRIGLIHNNMDFLLEKEPATVGPLAEKINGINNTIMSRVRSRGTRIENTKEATAKTNEVVAS